MGSCCLCFEHNTRHPFLFCLVVNTFSVLKGGCKITDERPIVELPYKGESLRTRAGAAMNNCSIFDGVAILSLSVTVRYVLLKRFGRDWSVVRWLVSTASSKLHGLCAMNRSQKGNAIFGKLY